jgi:hypothetical protein
MRIEDGDHVVACDFWNPGILGIAYRAWAEGKSVKFTAIYAASSHIPGDFAQQLPWASNAEAAWADVYDTIYTQTHFAAKSIPFKSVVTGLPFNPPKTYVAKKRKPWILFPHRPTPDKYVPEDMEPVRRALEAVPGSRLFTSYPIPELEGHPQVIRGGPSRGNLHKLQDMASVIYCPSKSETFGYAWMESVTRGCAPVTYDGGAYLELMSARYRYIDLDHAASLLIHYLENPMPEAAVKFRENLGGQFANVADVWAQDILVKGN